ncbi:cytosolic sulfotransferase 3-like [Scleropages formosus]|uniref:Sulfotransferase n=1 Tax=Scleropages formosus TaxID=113540 RepID=A0A0P7TL19_SCLFO|nr:cytosolic sulfotransferase 3-like [Scleropages formosus]
MAQRPRTFKFEGITMSHYFTDNWEKVKNFKAKPDDVVIATYPKAGTTWMCEILDQLYFGEMRKEGSLSPLYERVPFLEVCIEELSKGTDQIESLLTSPRLIKTHLPVQLVPQSFWEQNCRMIYVARNPKDSMDAAREISRLCSFLGLSPAEKQKQEVLRKTGFDEMKKNFADEISKIKIFDESISPFMRKGAVGDWKNHFTAAQNEAFDEEYRKKMKNSDLKFRMEI